MIVTPHSRQGQVLMLMASGICTFRGLYQRELFGEYLGPDRTYAALDSLRLEGAVAHVRYGQWELTEKGKIAAALLVGVAGRA